MRAVLDTNVLISSVISTGVPHEIVVKGFSSEYQIVVSVATLTEFRDTLLKYPEKFHMDEEDIQEEVDPDDDKFLEAAVAGNVDYIVSGDRHLLDLASFRGIDIVEPRAFYERLTTQ
jgi:predicted nucleic acid-binding protein